MFKKTKGWVHVQTDLLQLIQDTHKVLSQALHTWELKAATVKNNILTLHQIAKFDWKGKKRKKKVTEDQASGTEIIPAISPLT